MMSIKFFVLGTFLLGVLFLVKQKVTSQAATGHSAERQPESAQSPIHVLERDVQEVRTSRVNQAINALEPQALAGQPLDPALLEELRDTIRGYQDVRDRLVIRQFPRWLYPYLSEVTLEVADAFSAMDLSVSEKHCSGYYPALIDVLGNTPNADAAEWLFAELDALPDFRFPSEVPSIWSMEFHNRGPLGRVAKALVSLRQFEGQKIFERYCDRIAKCDGARQRVLIWAMRESSESEDFDYLMNLRTSLSNPDNAREIIFSLNSIKNNIRLDTDPSTDADGGDYGPHYFQVFPMNADQRQALADRQLPYLERATELLKKNELLDEFYGTKY